MARKMKLKIWLAEEIISKIKDGVTEIIQYKQRRKNKLKGNEQSFRDLGDYTKDVTFVLLAEEEKVWGWKNTQRNNGWKLLKFSERH